MPLSSFGFPLRSIIYSRFKGGLTFFVDAMQAYMMHALWPGPEPIATRINHLRGSRFNWGSGEHLPRRDEEQSRAKITQLQAYTTFNGALPERAGALNNRGDLAAIIETDSEEC